jgi:peroxiredoxin
MLSAFQRRGFEESPRSGLLIGFEKPLCLACRFLAFMSLVFIMLGCGEKEEGQRSIPGLPEPPADAVILDPGDKAPDFSAKDLSGQEISLKQFQGKIVLLDFWASWCPPCISELPDMKSLHEKYDGKDFVIVSVSLDTELSKCESFVKDKQLKWIQIWEGVGGEIGKKYGIIVLPATFLIGRDGVIVHTYLRAKEIGDVVKDLIKG